MDCPDECWNFRAALASEYGSELAGTVMRLPTGGSPVKILALVGVLDKTSRGWSVLFVDGHPRSRMDTVTFQSQANE
jgi:hypothetical protein